MDSYNFTLSHELIKCTAHKLSLEYSYQVEVTETSSEYCVSSSEAITFIRVILFFLVRWSLISMSLCPLLVSKFPWGESISYYQSHSNSMYTDLTSVHVCTIFHLTRVRRGWNNERKDMKHQRVRANKKTRYDEQLIVDRSVERFSVNDDSSDVTNWQWSTFTSASVLFLLTREVKNKSMVT